NLRRDLEGAQPVETRDDKPLPVLRTLFIVERSNRLQTALRDGFKRLGFRVLLSGEPARAFERFRMQPYDALIIDAGTVGPDGREYFERILAEARVRKLPCVGVLFLKEDQGSWKDQIASAVNQAVMVQPVSIKQLYDKLQELSAAADGKS